MLVYDVTTYKQSTSNSVKIPGHRQKDKNYEKKCLLTMLVIEKTRKI